MKYSEHIYYTARYEYQLWQLGIIYNQLGGQLILPGWEGEIKTKNVILFANQASFSKHPDSIRVYVGHGTSNKMQHNFIKDRGKDLYNYYWTSGPKYRVLLEEHGHYVEGKEVKIGNLRFDWYFNKYSKSNVMKELGIQNSRKLIIFAPTFRRDTFIHCDKIITELLKEYNLVLKAHPTEIVECKRPHQRLKVYTGDIADILWAADVLITDESSVAYDFTITGKPIVMCPPVSTTSVEDDDKYDLMKHTAVYHYFSPYKDDIMEKIEEAESRTNEVKQLCKDAFWYQDGYATDRACDWIRKIIDERFS